MTFIQAIHGSDLGRKAFGPVPGDARRAFGRTHAKACSRAAFRRSAVLQGFTRLAEREAEALRDFHRPEAWQNAAPHVVQGARPFGLSGLATIVGSATLLWAFLGAGGHMLLR